MSNKVVHRETIKERLARHAEVPRRVTGVVGAVSFAAILTILSLEPKRMDHVSLQIALGVFSFSLPFAVCGWIRLAYAHDSHVDNEVNSAFVITSAVPFPFGVLALIFAISQWGAASFIVASTITARILYGIRDSPTSDPVEQTPE